MVGLYGTPARIRTETKSFEGSCLNPSGRGHWLQEPCCTGIAKVMSLGWELGLPFLRRLWQESNLHEPSFGGWCLIH